MYHLKISLGFTQKFHMVLEKEKNGQQIPGQDYQQFLLKYILK